VASEREAGVAALAGAEEEARARNPTTGTTSAATAIASTAINKILFILMDLFSFS
jgi:hypothetical protein